MYINKEQRWGKAFRVVTGVGEALTLIRQHGTVAPSRTTSSKVLRLPRKKDHAFGFDPPAFGFDPLQNAMPVTFWHVRVRFRPPVL